LISFAGLFVRSKLDLSDDYSVVQEKWCSGSAIQVMSNNYHTEPGRANGVGQIQAVWNCPDLIQSKPLSAKKGGTAIIAILELSPGDSRQPETILNLPALPLLILIHSFLFERGTP